MQKEEAKTRREAEERMRKEMVKTHFGPEEEPINGVFSKTMDFKKKTAFKNTIQ